MGALLNTCTICYEQSLPECVEAITVVAGLTASTAYWVSFENRFGQFFTDRLTTDTDGTLVIDLAKFEDYKALFSHTAGVFTLRVFKRMPTDCDASTLTLCGAEYSCVKLTFKQVFNVSEDDLTATIPCECGE